MAAARAFDVGIAAGDVPMTLLEQCREHLRYEPETGFFFWIKCDQNKFMVGKRAGYVATKGYRQIKLCNVAQMEHVLAWLMFFGELPDDQIDHRNEIKSDNRIDNLRAATNQTNRLFVARPQVNNKSSGVRGVHRWRGNWVAHIRYKGRLISLGVYGSIAVAAEAYMFAKSLILEDLSQI